MTRKALIIVDVQPTFCEGGELPVTGGNAVAAAIADFVAAHRGDYDLVATTQDWHINPGAHFSDAPDFVDSWPAHGVAGTPGADLHPALARVLHDAPADVRIRKGAFAAAYSGFDGTDENGRRLELALRAHGVNEVHVVGIAESHCVKATALDARAAGFDVVAFTDLTVPVTAELGAAARAEMAAHDVMLRRSGLRPTDPADAATMLRGCDCHDLGRAQDDPCGRCQDAHALPGLSPRAELAGACAAADVDGCAVHGRGSR